MKIFPDLPRTRLQRWNRRQLKKLCLGEFQELGFTLTLTFHTPLDVVALEPFWDAIITHIEAQGLCIGGLGGRLPITEMDGFVSRWGRGTVTPEQQASLLDWCQTRPEVKQVHADELCDAWHGWGS